MTFAHLSATSILPYLAALGLCLSAVNGAHGEEAELAPPISNLADGGMTPTWSELLVQQTVPEEYTENELEGGKHIRFGTLDRGPVHVWIPPGYKPNTANTIVYLHGYYTH